MTYLTKHLRFCFIAAIFAASLEAGNITYDGSFTDGINTVDFSIITDGVIGVVQAADIVGGSLTETGPNPVSVSLQYSYLAGSDLTADAQDLDFDFSATDAAYYQVAFKDSSSNYYNLEFENSYDLPYNGDNILLAEPSGANDVYSPSQAAGAVEIGAAEVAPEPASVVTTFGGCMILGLAAWKRRRQSSFKTGR